MAFTGRLFGAQIQREFPSGRDARGRANPIRVVLADGHPLMLKGVNALLSRESDFRVLELCTSGDAALSAVRMHRPDILVLGLRMPDQDGLSVIRAMADALLTTRVVLLVASIDDQEILEAGRLGVRGVVLKEMAPQLLLLCLRKVQAGEPWLERRTVMRGLETLLRREENQRELSKLLSAREIEILRIVVTGQPNKAVAERVRISEGTVKSHLHHIYEKLHVRNRIELLLYCKQRNIA